jgi:hypothetical protein
LPGCRDGWIINSLEETVVTQDQSEQGGRIVVGIDGSVPSKAALRWAIRRGKPTGAVVDRRA